MMGSSINNIVSKRKSLDFWRKDLLLCKLFIMSLFYYVEKKNYTWSFSVAVNGKNTAKQALVTKYAAGQC